jgi:hypothetical protein
MDIDLGLMPRTAADTLASALHNKTYLRFRIDRGIGPAGISVNLHVDPSRQQESREEVLAFALYCFATEVGKGNA